MSDVSTRCTLGGRASSSMWMTLAWKTYSVWGGSAYPLTSRNSVGSNLGSVSQYLNEQSQHTAARGKKCKVLVLGGGGGGGGVNALPRHSLPCGYALAHFLQVNQRLQLWLFHAFVKQLRRRLVQASFDGQKLFMEPGTQRAPDQQKTQAATVSVRITSKLTPHTTF